MWAADGQFSKTGSKQTKHSTMLRKSKRGATDPSNRSYLQKGALARQSALNNHLITVIAGKEIAS